MSRAQELLAKIAAAKLEVEIASARRDNAIREAAKAGIVGREIGEAAGISKGRVSQIVNVNHREEKKS